jgi:hypothetical protein
VTLPFCNSHLLVPLGTIQSAGYDVLSLWAFLALRYGKLYLLAFCQSLETAVLDSAVMYEYIWAIALRNESKAFRFVKKLNLASHCV